MKRLILRWILSYPITLFGAIFFRLFAPLVAIFVYRELRQDTVKRLNKQEVLLNRDYIVDWLSWFATFDNAADEWWYGMYNVDFSLARVRNWTQDDYDSCLFIRYFCRVAWLWRNSGYGFAQTVLGIEAKDTLLNERIRGEREYNRWHSRRDTSKLIAWQVKGKFYFTSARYLDINIGWKPHKGFSRLMYAGRILAFRKD